MDKLIEFLKVNASDLFSDIKIVNIAYNKATNTLVVKVVYKEDFNFDETIKNRLKTLINSYLNITNLKIEIKSKKNLPEETAIKELIKYFINKNFASVFATMQTDEISVNIAENLISVNLQILSVFNDYLKQKNFDIELKNFLERNFFQNFEVGLTIKNDDKKLNEEFDEHLKIFESIVQSDLVEAKPTTFEIFEVNPIVGQQVENIALATSSLNANCVNVTVAGEINFIVKKSYVSKRKNSEGEEKFYYSFVLNDGYGKVNCVYFPQKNAFEKFEEILEKSQIAVVGDTEEFNGRLNFKVKGIASCVIPEKEPEVIEAKTENKEYKFVKPQPYISLMQATLFDVVKENTNKFLKDNDCVVFDVETTGLDATTCEIIEIGACKVRDGKLIETFSCLIKPSQPIPDEITHLTGITNQMVENCYTIKEVLQDFYKFTRNSVLVAYNIAFDYKFIYLAGSAQGYNFDNKQIDAMVLARTKLRGLKNYKLKTVVEKLNVPLENAHRAVNDAIATAEAFIKLVDSDYVV